MVDSTDSNAEFGSDAQGSLGDIGAFLELLNASIHILFEKVFHALAEHHFAFFFLVGPAGQSDHFTIVDVKRRP